MDDIQPSDRLPCQQVVYEIRIRDHLHDRRAALFEGMTITRHSDGTTVLLGPLPDQTALHGILLRIRDMNLQLISVNRIEVRGENWPSTQDEDQEPRGQPHARPIDSLT